MGFRHIKAQTSQISPQFAFKSARPDLTRLGFLSFCPICKTGLTERIYQPQFAFESTPATSTRGRPVPMRLFQHGMRHGTWAAVDTTGAGAAYGDVPKRCLQILLADHPCAEGGWLNFFANPKKP